MAEQAAISVHNRKARAGCHQRIQSSTSIISRTSGFDPMISLRPKIDSDCEMHSKILRKVHNSNLLCKTKKPRRMAASNRI